MSAGFTGCEKSRVHRVNIASMSDQLQDPHVTVTAEYCRSELQTVGGLTKIIPPAERPHTMMQFGMTASTMVRTYMQSLPVQLRQFRKPPEGPKKTTYCATLDIVSSRSRQEGGTRKSRACLLSGCIRLKGFSSASKEGLARTSVLTQPSVCPALHAITQAFELGLQTQCGQCRRVEEPFRIAQSSAGTHLTGRGRRWNVALPT